MQRLLCVVVVVIGAVVVANFYTAEGGGRRRPHRILLDTDVGTDDVFALLYLLKLDRSEFDLQVFVLSTSFLFPLGF